VLLSLVRVLLSVDFLGAFLTIFFLGGGLNVSPSSGYSLKLNFLLPPPMGISSKVAEGLFGLRSLDSRRLL